MLWLGKMLSIFVNEMKAASSHLLYNVVKSLSKFPVVI